MHREISRSGVAPWPTRTGWAVISSALAVKLITGIGLVGIGALVALAVLMVLDYLISMAALYRRDVVGSVARSAVVAPDDFLVTFNAPKGAGHLHLFVARVSLFATDSDFVTLRSNETTTSVSVPNAAWGCEGYFRFRSDLSIMGLVLARRWTTQTVPELCHVPAPVSSEAEIHGVTDAGRLRPYLAGDRMNTVSWGTTARTGQLHVRASAPDPDQITMVVDLGPTLDVVTEHGELVIGQALDMGERILAQGQSFRLITNTVVPQYVAETQRLVLASPWRRDRPSLKSGAAGADAWSSAGSPRVRVKEATIFDRDALVRELSTAQMGPAIPRPARPFIEVSRAGVHSIS